MTAADPQPTVENESVALCHVCGRELEPIRGRPLWLWCRGCNTRRKASSMRAARAIEAESAELPEGAGVSAADHEAAIREPTESELRAIALALDELTAYVSTVGAADEAHARQQWAIRKLRRFLDRIAANEHLVAAANRHGRVVPVEPVRFTYRPDTPPSGPKP